MIFLKFIKKNEIYILINQIHFYRFFFILNNIEKYI